MHDNLKEDYKDIIFALFPRLRFFSLALLVFFIEHVKSFHLSEDSIANSFKSFWIFLLESNIKSLFDSSDGLFYNVNILSIGLAGLFVITSCILVRWLQSGFFDLFMFFQKNSSRIEKTKKEALEERTDNPLLNIELAKKIEIDLNRFKNELQGYSYLEEFILISIVISAYSAYYTVSFFDISVLVVLSASYIPLCLYVVYFYFTKILPRSIRHEELLKT